MNTTILVEGMMCGMCECHINESIRSHFDVKKVRANRLSGSVDIVSSDFLDENELRKVIDEAGYKMTVYFSE